MPSRFNKIVCTKWISTVSSDSKQEQHHSIHLHCFPLLLCEDSAYRSSLRSLSFLILVLISPPNQLLGKRNEETSAERCFLGCTLSWKPGNPLATSCQDSRKDQLAQSAVVQPQRPQTAYCRLRRQRWLRLPVGGHRSWWTFAQFATEIVSYSARITLEQPQTSIFKPFFEPQIASNSTWWSTRSKSRKTNVSRVNNGILIIRRGKISSRKVGGLDFVVHLFAVNVIDPNAILSSWMAVFRLQPSPHEKVTVINC